MCAGEQYSYRIVYEKDAVILETLCLYSHPSPHPGPYTPPPTSLLSVSVSMSVTRSSSRSSQTVFCFVSLNVCHIWLLTKASLFLHTTLYLDVPSHTQWKTLNPKLSSELEGILMHIFPLESILNKEEVEQYLHLQRRKLRSKLFVLSQVAYIVHNI